MALTPDQQAELNDLLSEYNNLQDDTNASAAEHQEMAEKLGNLTRQEIEHLKQQATIRDAMIGALDNILALQQGIGLSIQDQIKDTATYLDQLQKMQGFKEKAELMANAERQLGRDLVRQAEEKLKLAKQSQNPQAIKDSVEELANAKKQKKMLRILLLVIN